jgi:hypothetical protein
MKLPIMQFSPASYRFTPPKPKYSKILFSHTFSLHPSLDVRKQVSHSYKPTGKTISKTIVFNILIFMVLDGR